jgi:hypothetical protein
MSIRIAFLTNVIHLTTHSLLQAPLPPPRMNVDAILPELDLLATDAILDGLVTNEDITALLGDF